MRENKLSFPDLEKQLKRTRMFATHMAESVLDEARCITDDDDRFKDSCIEDAREYTIVQDPKTYNDNGYKHGGDVTLIRATFPPKEISEHYHQHIEAMIIESGIVSFTIRGCDVVLDDGSSIKIPSNSFHTCEFKQETVALVGLPTSYVKKHLAFPAS